MTPQTVTLWIGAGTASAALLGLAGRTLRGVWRSARRIGRFIDDVTGSPARDGVEARPSLMARIATLESVLGQVLERVDRVERQVHPNGSTSMADAVSRIAVQVGTAPIPPTPPSSPPEGSS